MRPPWPPLVPSAGAPVLLPQQRLGGGGRGHQAGPPDSDGHGAKKSRHIIVLSRWKSYHGMTLGALAVSGRRGAARALSGHDPRRAPHSHTLHLPLSGHDGRGPGRPPGRSYPGPRTRRTWPVSSPSRLSGASLGATRPRRTTTGRASAPSATATACCSSPTKCWSAWAARGEVVGAGTLGDHCPGHPGHVQRHSRRLLPARFHRRQGGGRGAGDSPQPGRLQPRRHVQPSRGRRGGRAWSTLRILQRREIWWRTRPHMGRLTWAMRTSREQLGRPSHT
jgi:hypothetical protein